MDDPYRSFTDLITSWTKAQEQAWHLQSKMYEEATATFAKAMDNAEASEVAPDSETGSPFDDIWSQSQETFNKWSQHVEAAIPPGTENEIGAELLCHLMDPGAWLNIGINELNRTIETMAEGTQFAELWGAERRSLRASREWLELRRHSLRYRYVIMSAWIRAFGRFSEELNKAFKESGTPPSDWQGLLETWLDIANKELLKTQRSDEFLGAQRDLLRASIDFRTFQQGLVEEFCEANAIPTRTEVDDLHRRVTELRREMRALKREPAQERAGKGRATKVRKPAVAKARDHRAKPRRGAAKDPVS